MKFRGLAPETRLARWGLLAMALGLAVGGTAPRALAELASVIAAYHDSLPWYAMRLLGFVAYLALAGSVLYGLLLSTGILDAVAHRPISFALHQDLASVGLGLAGVHGALLLLDRTVPFSVLELATPGLAPYRPVFVAAGQVALYLTLAVVASFYLRRRIGQRAWRALHYVTFVAFVGATVHGVFSGTDTAEPWATAIYQVATILVASLVVYRVLYARGAPRPAPRRQPVPTPVGGPAQARRPLPVTVSETTRQRLG